MKRLICWDLDETLGFFRPVGDELVRRSEAGPPQVNPFTIDDQLSRLDGVYLRPGMHELLNQISMLNIEQIVATGAVEEYAELALRITGLSSCFRGVHCRDQVWDRSGKRYRPILEAAGVTPEQLLIIGDSFERDRPVDDPTRSAVLICEADGLRKPAHLLYPLIMALNAASTIRGGFEELLARSRPRSLDQVVRVGSVEAVVGYWGDHTAGEKVPVITDIREVT